MNYRIYANNRKFGWEHLTTVYSQEHVYKFIEFINPENYDRIMVIEHDIELDQDTPFLVKPLDKGISRVRKWQTMISKKWNL